MNSKINIFFWQEFLFGHCSNICLDLVKRAADILSGYRTGIRTGNLPVISPITSLKCWNINCVQVCQIEFLTSGKVCTHLAWLFLVREATSEGQLPVGERHNQLRYPPAHLYPHCFALAIVFFNGLLLQYRQYAYGEKFVPLSEALWNGMFNSSGKGGGGLKRVYKCL